MNLSRRLPRRTVPERAEGDSRARSITRIRRYGGGAQCSHWKPPYLLRKNSHPALFLRLMGRAGDFYFEESQTLASTCSR